MCNYILKIITMRIAIQLAGEFRSWKDVEDSFFNNVIMFNIGKGHNVDIFIHSYEDVRYQGLYFQKIQPTDSVLENKENVYTPSVLLNSKHNHDGIYHHYRKVYDCNEMRKKYEYLNNISYDVIYKTRFDLIYYEPVDFGKMDLKNNKLFCAKEQQLGENAKYVEENPLDYPSDACYICSPSLMDNICNRLKNMNFLLDGHLLIKEYNVEPTIKVDIVRYFENGEPRFGRIYYDGKLADKHMFK